jgi:hypothetical protein
MIASKIVPVTLSIPIQESDCYHEAGHAAVFAYYGIPLKYVRIRPDLVAGYGGSVEVAVEPPTSGLDELQNWMRASAAGEVAASAKAGAKVPTAEKLIAKIMQGVKSLIDYPESAIHNDMRSFATFGLYRDGATEPEQAKPEGWIPVWLECEELVRGKLWAAVEAVAGHLWGLAIANIGKDIAMIPDVPGDEAASMVRAAIGEVEI